MIQRVAYHDAVTTKSEKNLRRIIEILSNNLIEIVSKQGLAFQIILVNAFIHLSNMAQIPTANEWLSSTKHILLKYQSKVL